MSKLEELQSRVMLTRPGPSDRDLIIREANMGSWTIADAHGVFVTVYSPEDILAIVSLQFRTVAGARAALNEISDEPQVNYQVNVSRQVQSMNHDMVGLARGPQPESAIVSPGQVFPEDIPPPPAMSPEAQARARALAASMRDRARPERPREEMEDTDQPIPTEGI